MLDRLGEDESRGNKASVMTIIALAVSFERIFANISAR
jgi:hypothetical protein